MIFVAFIISAIIIYDVYALIYGGTDASISHLIITWSYQHPILPFTMGIVMGHLFWRMKQTKALMELKAYTKDIEDELKKLQLENAKKNR